MENKENQTQEIIEVDVTPMEKEPDVKKFRAFGREWHGEKVPKPAKDATKKGNIKKKILIGAGAAIGGIIVAGKIISTVARNVQKGLSPDTGLDPEEIIEPDPDEFVEFEIEDDPFEVKEKEDE